MCVCVLLECVVFFFIFIINIDIELSCYVNFITDTINFLRTVIANKPSLIHIIMYTQFDISVIKFLDLFGT